MRSKYNVHFSKSQQSSTVAQRISNVTLLIVTLVLFALQIFSQTAEINAD